MSNLHSRKQTRFFPMIIDEDENKFVSSICTDIKFGHFRDLSHLFYKPDLIKIPAFITSLFIGNFDCKIGTRTVTANLDEGK